MREKKAGDSVIDRRIRELIKMTRSSHLYSSEQIARLFGIQSTTSIVITESVLELAASCIYSFNDRIVG